jgi:filamentous hemagglutinin family protein
MTLVTRHRNVVLNIGIVVTSLTIASLGLANPTNPSVIAGQATISGLGTSAVTIQQATQQAIINWQHFNIAPNEVTRFIQPNVSAIALNRIFDQNPSQILGSLQANGNVILLNPNGILFGPNAQVNVGGLIASSLNLTNANFLRGNFLFQGTGVEGWVKNAGSIQGTNGVYLLAPNVENSGIITSPGGNIVLGAGSTAYLSNRPDGHGFLAEITAPTGQAVNLKDLIADGGNITLAGRVVNQQGLIQANSVREQNGKIELYASDTLTLAAGSQTIAKGDQQGVSNGGTVTAIADKSNPNGQATFEKGAVIDVSGGAQGGNGGSVEFSGSHVSLGGLFQGMAQPGYRGGQLLIDPITDVNISNMSANGLSTITFSTPIDPTNNPTLQPMDANGNLLLLPGNDLRVTGIFDANNLGVAPGGTGTIQFLAGRDLIFNNVFLTNSGTAVWNYVGKANGNINMVNSSLVAGVGSNITLQAVQGTLSLVDPSTGVLSSVRTKGGIMTLLTGQDLIASIGNNNDFQSGCIQGVSCFLDSNIAGILLDGGTLNATIGRNFLGGNANGVPSGPGFTVRNDGQANVIVHGDVGQVGGNGSTAGYADFAIASATPSGSKITVTADGNIYLKRVRDAGLICSTFSGAVICDKDADGNYLPPQLTPGLQYNQASFTSNTGNVYLDTALADAGITSDPTGIQKLSSYLPATFNVQAPAGSIYVQSDLKFFPSPTGNILFSAQNNIQGVPKTRLQNDPNFEWLYVGYGGLLGGQWIPVDIRTIPQHPELWPFLSNIIGSSTLPPLAQATQPSGAVDSMKAFPNTQVAVNLSAPNIQLMQVDPTAIAGVDLSTASSLIGSNTPAAVNSSTVGNISFKTILGDISTLNMTLVSRSFPKQITIQAGNDISQVFAQIYAPNLGTQNVTVTEQVPLVRDAVTGALRAPVSTDIISAQDVTVASVDVTVPVPKVAALIAAGRDINLTKPSLGSPGGIALSGAGAVQIVAGRDLNLANSSGIQQSLPPGGGKSTDIGGLIDIAVGRDLLMTQSRIVSITGAGISIHGTTQGTSYVLGYDDSALHPTNVPDSVRGTVNLPPPLGGQVNVGTNVNASQDVLSAGPTGIRVTSGGTVGVKAQTPVVNPDGTVSVSLVRDPTAIGITATGDVNVNQSRIATFFGGDIVITSTQGNINAGSGGANEQVPVAINRLVQDANGNLSIQTANFKVPGSGIFTFHPDDPNPLIFPVFNDPQLNAMLAEVNKLEFFGRDASALLAQANQLRAEREQIFNTTVKAPFINSLKLGDITLNAEQGRIIIPPGGIRGRVVTLNSPFLDFQGGAVSGNVQVPPSAAISGSISISGTATGSAAAQSATVSSVSGSSAVASVSATSAAVSTSAKSSESAQEKVEETSTQQAAAKAVASKTGEEERKKQLAKSVRVKRGVVIQVDVKPEAKQGS